MKLKRLLSLKGMLISVVAVLVLAGASYAGLEATSTTQFCTSCHVMEDAYQSWSHSAHREAVGSCSDCHIPKSLGRKITYKIASGTHDIYVNLTGPPDVIRAKESTRQVVNENCKKCHAGLVEDIHLGERKCTDCHRHTPHGR